MKTRRVFSDLRQRSESRAVANSRVSAKPQEGEKQRDPQSRLGWGWEGVPLCASQG